MSEFATVPRSPLPASDLRTCVEWALLHGELLFTAGERVVLQCVLALPDDAAELYARLSLRTGEVFFVDDLAYEAATPDAISALVAAELLHTTVPDDRVIPAATVLRFKVACQRLGLPMGKRRADFEAILHGQPWNREAVVLVRHRGLLQRCARIGGFDRSLAPVERIAGTVWAEYVPTGGEGVFPHRSAMLRYERVRAGDWQPGEALAMAAQGPPPFGPSNFRWAVEQVLTEPHTADDLAGLVGCDWLHVRQLEKEGREADALARCRQGSTDPELAIALARTGHRLAKRLRADWPPVQPLIEAQRRTLRLARAEGVVVNGRPTWQARGGDGEEPLPIEAAVVRALAAVGRNAIHAENWFWTGVFALVFREAYFAPVPGMLPTPRRAGPIDLGTPTFYLQRRELTETILSRLREVGVGPFLQAWQGERLDGLFNADLVVEHAVQLSGTFLESILRPLLVFGWTVARGLPDLLVLPGGEAKLPDAIPATLQNAAFLAEIKGPADTLRDAQRLWHDRLRRAGNNVELWIVSE